MYITDALTRLYASTENTCDLFVTQYILTCTRYLLYFGLITICAAEGVSADVSRDASVSKASIRFYNTTYDSMKCIILVMMVCNAD